MKNQKENKMRSDMIKVGVDKAPARGLLYATGQVKSAKDMQKPFIAICNSYIDIVPGHVHLRELADIAKEAIRELRAQGKKVGLIKIRSFRPFPAEDICEALKTQFGSMTFDGLTGEGMTWDASGAVSKAPKAVAIHDGAYTAM